MAPHNAKPPGVHNSNYSRPYPSNHQDVARPPKNNAPKVPEKRTKGLHGPNIPYGGYESAKSNFGPPPRPSRHSDKYGYYGNPSNNQRLPVVKEHNSKSKVPNVLDSRGDRWEGGDLYGDGGSSTSGSYILDLKDLGDSVDQSTYNAVVV